MTKKPAKRRRKAKRLEPADVLQARMEYYDKLAKDEMKLGPEGSRAKIDEYLKLAQDAAKELVPLRHARLTSNDVEPDGSRIKYIARIPAPLSKEEWEQKYCSPEAHAERERENDELKRRLENFFPGEAAKPS